MRFHYNTTPEETVSFLREQAIDAKQPPAVIDAIDALRDLADLPGDMEKLEKQVTELENDADDIKAELREAADAFRTAVEIIVAISGGPTDGTEYYDSADLKELQRQLKATDAALERHKA